MRSEGPSREGEHWWVGPRRWKKICEVLWSTWGQRCRRMSEVVGVGGTGAWGLRAA